MKSWVKVKSWAEAKQLLIKEIAADPCLLRFAGRMHSQDQRVNSPMDALGERKLVELNMLDEDVLVESPTSSPPADLLTGDWTAGRWLRLALANMMETAEVYWWPTEIVEEACSVPMPPHIIGRSLPGPMSWWTFQVEWHQPDGYDLQSCLVVDREVLAPDATPGMRLWGLYMKGDERVVRVGDIAYGSRYPEDAEPSGMFLSLLAFLNSPYTEVRAERLDRATRRDYKRLAKEAPTVRVIQLREAAAEHASRRSPEGREWSGHWWVKGHIRAQWYPSQKAHRPIWIPAYVKGDRSKGLIQHVYAVIR